jgi:phosphocarrier protein
LFLSFIICNKGSSKAWDAEKMVVRKKLNKEISKNVMVVNELGFHARAAAKIAKLAQNASSRVWLSKDNQEKVDASSIIDILTLACGKGSWVTISVEDKSDHDLLVNIVNLVENGFGE